MPGFRISQKELPDRAIDHKAEFLRQHRWLISDLGFPDSLSGDRAGKNRLALYAKSIELPAVDFEELNIKGLSLDYKIAKKAKFDAVTIKLYDIYGLHKIFDEWQEKIWTPSEGIKPADEYKGEAVFNLLDGDGNNLRKYRLKGAYPKRVYHDPLSMSDSEIKLLSVTYSFDWAERELFDRPSQAKTRTR